MSSDIACDLVECGVNIQHTPRNGWENMATKQGNTRTANTGKRNGGTARNTRSGKVSPASERIIREIARDRAFAMKELANR